MDHSILAWLGLVAALLVFLVADLKWFARGREPSFRQGLVWSIGWLALSLIAAIPLLLLEGSEEAILYTTVYLIERSLSLDNLFVFIILFAYFGVPTEFRARLLFWGIVAALVLRGGAIAGGVALLEQFHFVIYVLGALLILLAYRILRGVEESVDPDRNLMVRAVRRFYPVTGRFHGSRWFVDVDGRRHTTPLFLCLAAIVFADIAFAVDSIPAALAITRDPFIVWMGNVFALLGLRALFVLVEGLVRRFRFLDETIAIVLGVVGVKLLVEDLVKLDAVASFALVTSIFVIGILASVVADRIDPDIERRREERAERARALGAPTGEPERSPEPVGRR
jgi:tellurite resistance protein TerC